MNAYEWVFDTPLAHEIIKRSIKIRIEKKVPQFMKFIDTNLRSLIANFDKSTEKRDEDFIKTANNFFSSLSDAKRNKFIEKMGRYIDNMDIRHQCSEIFTNSMGNYMEDIERDKTIPPHEHIMKNVALSQYVISTTFFSIENCCRILCILGISELAEKTMKDIFINHKDICKHLEDIQSMYDKINFNSLSKIYCCFSNLRLISDYYTGFVFTWLENTQDIIPTLNSITNTIATRTIRIINSCLETEFCFNNKVELIEW